MASRATGVLAAGCGVLLVGASVVAPARDPVVAAPAAPAYRVTYRIEDRAGGDASVRTEVLAVRRPYDGRLENREPGSTAGRVTNREFQWQLSGRGTPRFGFRRAPGGPVRDVSFTALSEAAGAGVIDATGNGEALGRPCRWFALENPLPARLARATSENLVEACVDPSGILLREIWTIDSRVVRIVEASDLDLRPADDDDFLYGLDPEQDEVTDEEVAELLHSQAVVADDVPTPNVALDIDPPRGWKVDRRSVIVEGSVGGSRPSQTASTTFVRGAQLVIVEQGLRAGDEPAWAISEGEPIDPGIGTGRLLWFGDRVELRIIVDDGFARIFAPSLSLARAFAGGLRVGD